MEPKPAKRARTSPTIDKLFKASGAGAGAGRSAAPRPQAPPARVVNVKVAELRKSGYPTLRSWLADTERNVYIGRKVHRVADTYDSKWGNPYRVTGGEAGRRDAVEKYRTYLRSNAELMAALPELRGKNLGCWCKPLRCHGEVLVEELTRVLAEQQQQQETGKCDAEQPSKSPQPKDS
eukprot:m51a1_g1271 hypothetical protein (178) ;mRNA; r:97078-97611